MKRFYSDEDFLINSERLELGVTSEGEVIDDAFLPSWAKVIVKKKNQKLVQAFLGFS